MANTLSPLNKEIWSTELQEELEKILTSMRVTKIVSGLETGDTWHKPYRSRLIGQTYTKGTEFTAVDVVATDESGTVDTAKIVPILIDKIDMVQNSYNTRQEFTVDMVADLQRLIDASILAEYTNATSDIDDGDIGGTNGVSAVITESTVNRVFAAAARKLTNLRVGAANRFAIISPAFLEILQLYLAAKDTDFGDKVGMDGLVGNRFGFEIYVSNNLTYKATWTPADQPSNADTITINGVTLTFVTGTPTAAGEIKSETSTAVTLDNLVAFLDAPGASISGKSVAVTGDSLAALEGTDATDGTTFVSLEFVGGGDVVVAASSAADLWSVQTVHNLFGQKGAIELALQAKPQIGFNQAQKLIEGSGYLHAWTLFGKKTFFRMKDRLVNVKFDASALT